DRDIAMVFQNYALYPHMTIFENLAFGLKMRNYPKVEINQRVMRTAEMLGIKEFLDRKPKALSGGERQRVALGRAIVRQPTVFLFDEPLSNLDANLRVQMRTEISRLHNQLETTMIYVTHDQVEAMSMGNRIVVMKDGIVQQVDPPLTIYNKPENRFVASFIGSPTMNFFEGRLKRDGELMFQTVPGDLKFLVPQHLGVHLSSYENKDLMLGIRPEHITTKPLNDMSQKVTVQIQVREPVGNEIFIYFTLDKLNKQYVSRISADNQPPVGRLIDLFFDITKFHFFDKETGKAL
ncbi:MAG: ATP-binding cassette domain-containing protein, partial [Ignavibacteriae bacterium]|nr:ATP-binding cassette domain-containing protein [Ignavibacteriota bacterium]